MTGTDLILFTIQSVPVIFEPPCTNQSVNVIQSNRCRLRSTKNKRIHSVGSSYNILMLNLVVQRPIENTMRLFVFYLSTSRFNPRGESPVPTGYNARVLPNASLDVFEKRQISSSARNEPRFLGCRPCSLVTV
jgi:hypothetical protein